MTNQGNLLEDFSGVFLASIEGLVMRRKRAWAYGPKSKREHDYDLLMQNASSVFPEFGNYVLVECKDWDKKVGYDEVAKFIHKLHSRRCRTGVIIALGDVTHKDFNPTIKRAYDQDGIAVIVLELGDIQKVIDKQVNLSSLLRHKYEEVRFGVR